MEFDGSALIVLVIVAALAFIAISGRRYNEDKKLKKNRDQRYMDANLR